MASSRLTGLPPICCVFLSPMCKIEVPERLVVSYAALQKAGLTQRCVPLPVREATDEDILLAHR